MRNYLRIFLRNNNIDPIKKEYFTKGIPVERYGLGMILFFFWSMYAFENITDFVSAIFFIITLSGEIWFSYQFVIVLSYKKAPEDSSSRLLWQQDKEWRKNYISEKYDRLVAPLINSVIETIGFLSIWLFRISLLIAGIWLLSSFSVHSLLVLIVILILLK